MIVDLPEPGRADDEHELALLDHEGDAVERDDVRVVDLAHVLEDDHRLAEATAGCVPFSSTTGPSRRAAAESDTGVSRSSMHRARAIDATGRPRGRSGSGFAQV